MSADEEDVRAALLALWLSVLAEGDRISPFAMEQLGAPPEVAACAYAVVHNAWAERTNRTWLDALMVALELVHAEVP